MTNEEIEQFRKELHDSDKARIVYLMIVSSRENNLEKIKLLFSHSHFKNITFDDEDYYGALSHAVENNNRNMLDLIVSFGAKLTIFSNILLTEAVSNKKTDFVNYFLELNMFNNEATTTACEVGDLNILKILLPYENNLLRLQHDFVNAAIDYNHLNIVQFLIEEKIYIDYSDTVLKHAIKHEANDIVKYLLVNCNHDVSLILQDENTNKELLHWAQSYRDLSKLNKNLQFNLKDTHVISTKMKI